MPGRGSGMVRLRPSLPATRSNPSKGYGSVDRFVRSARRKDENAQSRLPESSGTLISNRRNRVRDRDRAPGHVGVQPLHHLAVELNRAARGVLRPLECRDDLAGMRDLLRGRREDRVAGHDLARMDQGLAVEAEIARLRAFQRKAVDIAEIAVGSVENFKAAGP